MFRTGFETPVTRPAEKIGHERLVHAGPLRPATKLRSLKMLSRTTTASASVASVASVLALSLLAACGSMQPTYSQAMLPAAVRVPAGNEVAMETVGVGEITYQCSPKKDMAGQFEWSFV